MRMLFADDHLLFADAIISLLKGENVRVEVVQAADLKEAMALAGAGKPFDVAILDLRMPGMKGVEGVTKFLERQPGLPVILISGAATATEVDQALALGAAGFVSKFLSGREFINQINGILSGRSHERPPGVDTYRSIYEKDLSSREVQVVRLVANGLSNEEIALSLGISIQTVKVHIQSIMMKSCSRNRTEIAISAIKHSLL